MTTAAPTSTTAAPAAAPPSTSASMSAPAPAGGGTGAPAASGTAAPAAGGTTETVNPGAWMAGFDDDSKAWINNKGYKNPADLANAHRSLEKLLGAPKERLVTLPENFYDDKGALTADGKAIYERLGMPKDPKEYGIEVPKEGGDPKRLEAFLKVAQDIGLTKAQAQKLNSMDSEFMTGLRAQAQEAAVQKFKDQDASIQKEWGAAYENNKSIAADAMRRLGLSNQEVDALSSTIGHDKTLKLLHNLGKSVGEGTFVEGTRPTQPSTPGDAKAKIKELQADKDFGSRLMTGEAQAKATWERLHKEAYPGTMTI